MGARYFQRNDVASGSYEHDGVAINILGRNLGVIDDTFYFQAWGSGGNGLWAYNTSNTTMWRTDISSGVTSSNPGKCMALVVGDTLYFDADGGYTGRELWAHNHVNQTSWLAKDFRTTGILNSEMEIRDVPKLVDPQQCLFGDTIYLAADDQNLPFNCSPTTRRMFELACCWHEQLLCITESNDGHRDTIYFDAPTSGLHCFVNSDNFG